MMPCGAMTDWADITAADRTAPDAAGADETPHAYLRRVSRPWHDDVESAFAPFDLQTFDGIAGFLLRQAMALFPLERTLERAGIADQLADWQARRRTPALAIDLSRLGLAIPAVPDLPDLHPPWETLGAAYVLEGSRLGGRVLHRRVLASPDPRVRAIVEFLGHQHERGWPRFLDKLNAAPRDASALAALRSGAQIAFSAFHAAARSELPARFADASTRSSLYHQAHA